MTKALLKHGIEHDQEDLVISPKIKCAHYSRLCLLNEGIENLRCCYHLYQKMSHDMFVTPVESAIYVMSVALEAYIQADLIHKRLATVQDKCFQCKQVCQIMQVEIDEGPQDVEEGAEDKDGWEE